MSQTVTENWASANQRYLMAALAVVREALERHVERAGGSEAAASEPSQTKQTLQTLQTAADAMPAPPALETLCATFGLSTFERDVLLLSAGVELDSSFARLCAAAQGDLSRAYPTFSLALATLTEPHWSALTPAGLLRHWRLIEVEGGGALTQNPLRIDEFVLHYLAGSPHLDQRLVGFVETVRSAGDLVPSHAVLAEQIVATLCQADGHDGLPVIHLCGDELQGKHSIAVAACAALGLGLKRIRAELIPTNAAELEALIRLLLREAALSSTALLIDCDVVDPVDSSRANAVSRLVERTGCPLIMTSRERRPAMERQRITLDVSKPSADEQCAVWQRALGEAAGPLNGQVNRLVTQFSLSPSAIRAACAASAAKNSTLVGDHLWDACRMQARPRMENLAQRIEPAASWDDLVLPVAQRETLQEIAAHVRNRATVYESWGFGSKGSRGLGISALFSGSSGTGKTMAAEVLARELRLDLYRIDLSAVVSKYIGETEKNLRRVFDAAEEGGAILLFDEADALFGKRSDVKDSHDRYANIEVSYLLQRMEAYRGLAILTTNMKQALDTAFLRRIRFVVQFPFPDIAQRAEIWSRVFPSRTPTDGLRPDRLSRLNVAGGNIRNIALNAAFLAADADEPVRMSHVLRAARSEYAKLEKPLSESEIGGWK